MPYVRAAYTIMVRAIPPLPPSRYLPSGLHYNDDWKIGHFMHFLKHYLSTQQFYRHAEKSHRYSGCYFSPKPSTNNLYSFLIASASHVRAWA